MTPKFKFPNIPEMISQWLFSSSGEQELVMTIIKFGAVVFVLLLVAYIIFAKVMNARDRF